MARWKEARTLGWGNKLEQLCFMFDIVIGFALGLADVVNSK